MGLDITVHRFSDKKQEDYFHMYDVNTETNEIIPTHEDFPEWTKKFVKNKVEKLYDFSAFKEKTGINLDDYHVVMMGPLEDTEKFKGNKEAYGYVLRHKDTDEDLVLSFEEIPVIKKKVPVIYWKEVGYQRKGLNSKFYKDYEDGKIGYFVWTKAELERYLDEYCDEDTEIEHGDTKYTATYKDNFRVNIIDKFNEGTDVVSFDW